MKLKYMTLLLFLVASPGWAHGTADNHLQIMVVGDRIKMNIVVDMRVLAIVDEDKDGYASLEELAARSHEMKMWIRQLFDVTEGGGHPGNVVFSDVTSDLNIASANGERVDHARILQTLVFAEPVRGLQIDLGQLVRVVPELRVTIIDAATGLHYRLRDPRLAQTIPLPT